MKIDSKKIRLTKRLIKLFEEKKGQISGLNLYEIYRMLKELIWIGDVENEPFNKRLQRVIVDKKSKKRAHIFYEWQKESSQNDDNNNRILKVRSFKKER
ncbi:MAG: hypothetical protein KJI71_00115 [Patescibacteria group bacterium]|nr:hypothetical protein [Patescibacteria group bacterium]